MSSHCGPAETNPTRNEEVEGRSLASISRLRIQHCRELWCRPAAVAPIRPLAWEFPYATGEALKTQKTKKKKEREKKGLYFGWVWKPGLEHFPSALLRTLCCCSSLGGHALSPAAEMSQRGCAQSRELRVPQCRLICTLLWIHISTIW